MQTMAIPRDEPLMRFARIERETVTTAFALIDAMRRPGGKPSDVTALFDRLAELKREHDAIPLYREPGTGGEW